MEDVTTANIYHAKFDSCEADGYGGAIYARHGALTVKYSEFTDSSDSTCGSAICGKDNDMYLQNCWFEHNSAPAVSNARLDIDVLESIFVENGSTTETDAATPSDIKVTTMSDVTIKSNTFYGSQNPSTGATITIDDSTVQHFDYNVMADVEKGGYAIYYQGIGDYYTNCNLFYGNNECDTTQLDGDCSESREHDTNNIDDDDIPGLDDLFASLSTYEIDPTYVSDHCDSDCDCSTLGGEAAGTWPLTFP